MAKHTTYRGTTIDMDMLKYQNQHQVALGNGHMNARGDKIGQGGTVIKTREELMQEKEREMQIPDFIPEHQSHSMEYGTGNDVWNDDAFEVETFEEPQVQDVQSEEKKPPRRAKTKDQE